MNSFNCVFCCFSKDGEPQEDVNLGVSEKSKTFSTMKMMFNLGFLNSGVSG